MPIPIIRAQISGIRPSQVRSNIVDIEEFSTTSYQDQTEIVFPTGKSYTQGTNSTFLFIDGKLIGKTKYTEQSSNVLKTNFPLSPDLEITVKWFRYNCSEPASNGSIIASEQEPDESKKVPGLIWLKPSQKKISIYTGAGFEDLATKKQVDDLTVNPNVANDRLMGGTF
jgi:hypothetical protein